MARTEEMLYREDVRERGAKTSGVSEIIEVPIEADVFFSDSHAQDWCFGPHEKREQCLTAAECFFAENQVVINYEK